MSSIAPPSQRTPAAISTRFPTVGPAIELALSGAAALKRSPLGWRGWLTVAAGTVVILVGLTLLVLPGPGSPLILAGLAMLAPHWPWAQRVLNRLKLHVESARARIRSSLS